MQLSVDVYVFYSIIFIEATLSNKGESVMKPNRIYEGAFVPVDKAASQITGKGYEYESNKKIVQRHWSAPPRMKPVPPEKTSLVGLQFGRFTVIGFFGERSKSKGGLWVVRCSCGDYETRRRKSIQNPNNDKDCCDNCRHLLFLKKEDERRRAGKNGRS